MTAGTLDVSHALSGVKYEIRGQLANRALELEKRGYEIISLNIGNPGLFGFRTPETMRLAMIETSARPSRIVTRRGSSRHAKRWSCSSRIADSSTLQPKTFSSAMASAS